ncbi:hypothetical protein ILFOPFJJ_06815 [Ensifer psoraleae]|nr:hypothetical protein [Sinorhizobium psoraleae]
MKTDTSAYGVTEFTREEASATSGGRAVFGNGRVNNILLPTESRSVGSAPILSGDAP